MIPSAVLTSTFALLASARYILDGCPRTIGPEGVQARIPPFLSTAGQYHHSKPWCPPPRGFYFKPWWMILATNPQYAAMRNIQYDPTLIDPKDPTGLVNDLFSFQRAGNDTIFTTYGVDTPDPHLPAVLDFAGTGILEGATSRFAILAWGCDANRVPYYTSYSTETSLTKTPPGIDLLSTNNQGPDQATVDAILKALKDLDTPEITEYVDKLNRTAQDGARKNLPRITCDDYCKTNEGLIGLIC